MNAIEALGLPFRVNLLALRSRVEPRCCFGAEYLIVRPDWRARLDRLQDGWATSLLGLEERQPRVVLLREMGEQFRLSTKTMVRALALKARIDMLPSTHICARVASVAEGCASTWFSVVVACCIQLGIPLIREWLQSDGEGTLSKTATKRTTKRYMDKAVWPAAMKQESAWRQDEDAKHPDTGATVMSDVLKATPSPSHDTIRTWSQLRLQRRIAVKGFDIKAMCPLCSSHNGATLEHLLSECGVAGVATASFSEQLMGGQTITAALFDCPSSATEVEMAMRLAMIWRKAILDSVRSGSHRGDIPSSSTELASAVEGRRSE